MQFADIGLGLQIIISIFLAWTAYRLNRQVTKLERKYDQSVQRIYRLRDLLSKATSLIIMSNYEIQNDGITTGWKLASEFMATFVELVAVARVIGGEVAEAIEPLYSITMTIDDDTKLSEITYKRAEQFRNGAEKAFEVIERQIEREVEAL